MKKMSLFASMLITIVLLCTVCHAQSVKVKIAPFYTQIENVSVDNRYVEYPLITYNDVTYFPMTYDLCTMLNLSIGFDAKEGLYITKYYTGEGGSRFFGSVNVINEKPEYNAVIPTYPVYLNGIKIDNTREEYPLLNFRNVTYFPMTWHFAVEELNFNIDFSAEKQSFVLSQNSRPSCAYVYDADENSLFLEDKIDVYEDYISEYGTTGHRLLYSYWDFYEVDLESETVSKLESEDEGKKVEYDGFRFGSMQASEITLSAGDDGIYLGDLLVMACNTENISDIQAAEYKTGDNCSLIRIIVYTGKIVPPYSYHNEYVFERVGDKFTNLDWDRKNNFSGVYSDDNGGFFVCSSGYSPSNMGRWSNSFSDVYYYKAASGTLLSYAEKYFNIVNSVEVIGKANGKLYVKSMWFDANKDRNGTVNFPISAVNSGFYEIDLEDGEMTKIYPYIIGEIFIAPNGTPYCNADYANKQRLVNLVTGNIVTVE